jgi:hypothetical protein
MNAPADTLRFKPEFDAFLFASVSADDGALPLSVLSVLARLDLDPWQEAADLAALSPDSAAQKIASILGALPTGCLNAPDIPMNATRLVAMLPRRTPRLSVPLRVLSAASAGTPRPRPHANVVFLAVYLIFMVASQFIWTRLLPAHADSQPAPPSSSTSSQAPPAPATK